MFADALKQKPWISSKKRNRKKQKQMQDNHIFVNGRFNYILSFQTHPISKVRTFYLSQIASPTHTEIFIKSTSEETASQSPAQNLIPAWSPLTKTHHAHRWCEHHLTDRDDQGSTLLPRSPCNRSTSTLTSNKEDTDQIYCCRHQRNHQQRTNISIKKI